MEVFKDIPHYEGLYQISDKGRVWSVKYNRYLKPRVGRCGYYQVELRQKNGKRKLELLHRLLALTFIPNPEKLPVVNHIDKNKLNNDISNLEWCSQQGNSLHSNCKTVKQYTLDGVLVKTYSSVLDAATENHYTGSYISHKAHCEDNTAYGYRWVIE